MRKPAFVPQPRTISTKVSFDHTCSGCKQTKGSYFGHPQNRDGTGFAFNKCRYEEQRYALRQAGWVHVNPASYFVRCCVVVDIVECPDAAEFWIPGWAFEFSRVAQGWYAELVLCALKAMRENESYRDAVLGAARLGTQGEDLRHFVLSNMPEEFATGSYEECVQINHLYTDGLHNVESEDGR